MKKTLLLLVKFLTIATFFMPLLVFPDSFVFPFIVPKVVFFRSLAILLLMSYILLFAINKNEFRPRFSWLHGALLLYILSLVVSTFVGVDWYNSFWDNHERMLGTFTIFHYVVYYFVLTRVFKTSDEWRTLQWWFLGAGALVLGVGLIQRVSPQFLLNGGSWRVIATLGNAIYVGGYGLFLAFLGYLVGIKETIAWKKYMAFLLSFLGVVGVFLSGTRGTMLGLFVSVGLLLLLYVILLKEYKKGRTVVAIIMAVGVLCLGILYLNRSSQFVENIPSLSRLLNTTLSSDTGNTRVMAWKIAGRSFQDYPVFGWGPNNFYYAFNQYYNPQFLYFGLGETWFDNAHNVVMNTLSTGGVAGIISYIALFIVAGYQLVYAYRKKKVDVHVMVVGISFLVGHFIHNVFVFENPTSYLYFFFFLAYIESVTFLPGEGKVLDRMKDKLLPGVIKFGVPVLALLFIYNTDINVARANNASLEALRALSQGQAQNALVLYKQSKEYGSPHIADIRNDFVRMGSQLVQMSLASQKVTDDVKQLFTLLYEEQKINHAFRPMDIRTHILQVQMDLLGNYINPQGGYLADAEALLADALRYSPDRQQLYFLTSSVKSQQGKSVEAISAARTAVEKDPRIGDSWIHLILAYTQNQQAANVPAIVQEAEKRGVIFSNDQKTTLKNSFGVVFP